MTAITRREESTSRDRGALARMVMTLLDHWQLSTEDQAALLGIAASNRAALARYRKGEAIGTSRMTTRNKAFGNLTPVEVIREWGFAGLLMVRSYLDRARGA